MAQADQNQTQHAADSGLVAQVFFDGACSLCRREIAHYRGLRGATRLAWVDISRDRTLLDQYGIGFAAAMERLHVRDAAGSWHTGAWAFAELWSHLPGYHWLARLLRASGTLPLLDRGYSMFARWRLRRRCDAATCGVDSQARGDKSCV